MIEQTILIPNATPKQVYEVLMDSTEHSKLTGDIAHVDPTEGGFYSTFSGYADGQTLKLKPYSNIQQTWRASDWDDEHYSTITFEFKKVPQGTEISFKQTDLPEGTESEFEAGWNDNYWNRMKEYFTS